MLLILAGIALNLTIGENGLFTRAESAVEQAQIGEEKEAISLAMQSLFIDKQLNPDIYENGIINATQLKNEMNKGAPKPANVSLDNSSKDLTVTFDESRNNRTYTVGQDGTIKLEGEQPPVQTTSIYAKLYTYTDGSGDVLELASTPDFEDTSGTVTLKEDYGDIGADHYYLEHNENYTENESYNEETGLMPPWLEKVTDVHEGDGQKATFIYYAPNEDIIEVKIVDKIEPTYTSYLFYNLSNLNNIENIQNIDTKNTLDMSYMFASCSSLTNLDLSNWDVSNVTDINYMFTNSGITNLNLSNWNTVNVTDMSAVFYDCENLQTLNLDNWNTRNVTSMGGADENDSSLGMFAYCYSLVSLNLSYFDTSNVKDMSNMFGGCNSLTSLDLSNKFDTSNVTDMFGMFSCCIGLTSLDLSSFDTSNVTDMSMMFDRCSGLTSLDLSKFDTSNVTDMRGMFSECRGLTSLDLSSFDTSKVTKMGDYGLAYGMFSDCTNLEELDLSSFDTRNVTDMRAMFARCVNLRTVYIGQNWSTSQANTENMYYNILSNNITFTKK